MKRLTYLKTGLTHYVKEWGDSIITLCSIYTNEEDWTDDPDVVKKICKRCRVASGVPGRLVYNYGPRAWKRSPLRYR